jgi:hypothetical protein
MFTRTLALIEPAGLAVRLPDFVALTKPRVVYLFVLFAALLVGSTWPSA